MMDIRATNKMSIVNMQLFLINYNNFFIASIGDSDPDPLFDAPFFLQCHEINTRCKAVTSP